MLAREPAGRVAKAVKAVNPQPPAGREAVPHRTKAPATPPLAAASLALASGARAGILRRADLGFVARGQRSQREWKYAEPQSREPGAI